MKSILVNMVFFAMLAVTTVANAGQEPNPMDDRSSAFVAGDAIVAETFGQTEGLVMMGLAVISLVATFALLLMAGRIDNTCSATLGKLGQLLRAGSNDDA
ncbi:MAG: hypothetical protein GY854_33715 [Deltaproteobacteria bacterium]|nr:hypothetical protein [Deltaproteobacteria bacterium]